MSFKPNKKNRRKQIPYPGLMLRALNAPREAAVRRLLHIAENDQVQLSRLEAMGCFADPVERGRTR